MCQAILDSIHLTNKNIEYWFGPRQKSLRGLTPPTDIDPTKLLLSELKLTNRLYMDCTDYASGTRTSEAHTGAYLSSKARTSMGMSLDPGMEQQHRILTMIFFKLIDMTKY